MFESMQVTCRIFQDRAGEWRWTWVAGNGEKVATAGEGYGSRAAAWHAANRVANATVFMPPAPKRRVARKPRRTTLLRATPPIRS